MTAINMLIDLLPETVTVGGDAFEIHSDFRTGILMEQLVTAQNITPEEKLRAMLELYYETVPSDIIGSVHAILWFFRCGKQQKKKTDAKKDKLIRERAYDFDHDAEMIYAAFRSDYGIDLNDIEYLHWWKFCALFRGLKDGNEIVKAMAYRCTDISKISGKAEKQRIIHMKNLYALPSALTHEEKVAKAGAIFGGG